MCCRVLTGNTGQSREFAVVGMMAPSMPIFIYLLVVITVLFRYVTEETWHQRAEEHFCRELM
jgi:hypothetical protein